MGNKITRALISVTDKKGIVEFAKGLKGFGVEILSTGGTAAQIKAAGIDVSVGVFDDDDAHKMGYTTQYAGNLVGLSRLPGASGLTWDQAFASMSSVPAKAVGMDGAIGSLRAGRAGDIVIWDNDPLELGSRPAGRSMATSNVTRIRAR